MPKKISKELLDQLTQTGNVVDDLLDEQARQIEDSLGWAGRGLGTQILSLFVENGARRQWSEQALTEVLFEKHGLEERKTLNLLDRLYDSGLIHCTASGDYEIANNLLADRAYQKVRAENRVLRGILATIRDRMKEGELLAPQYLNYISASLPLLELHEEEEAFVERSKRAVRARKRREQAIYTAFLLLLLALSAWALRQTQETRERNFQLLGARDSLSQQNDYLNQSFLAAQRARDSAEMARTIAEIARDSAEYQRLRAEKNLIFALNQRDKADSLRQVAEVLATRAEALRKDALESAEDARVSADSARAARNRAEVAAEQARVARLSAEQANLVAVSLNAAAKSLDEEDPRLRALVARQAYNNILRSGDSIQFNQPFLYEALYTAVQKLQPQLSFSSSEHQGGVQDILIHPNGRVFFTAGSDGKVVQWVVNRWNPAGQPKHSSSSLNIRSGGVHNALSLSKDNRRLLVGGELDFVQSYGLESGLVDTTYFLPPNQDLEIFDLAYLSDDASFSFTAQDYFGSYLPSSFSWDLQETMKTPARGKLKFPDKTAFITGRMDFKKAEGTYLLQLSSWDGSREQETEYNLRREFRSYGRLTQLEGRQEGSLGVLAMGFENGQLWLMRMDLERLSAQDPPYELTRVHRAPIADIAFSYSGNYCAVASLDGSVSIWDLRYINNPTYLPIVLEGQSDWALSLAFTPDDRFLLSGTRDGQVFFWNLNAFDYADLLCEQLRLQFPGVRYDAIDPNDWRRYFGTLKNEKPCH